MYWRYVPRQRTSVVRWWRESSARTPADFNTLMAATSDGLPPPQVRLFVNKQLTLQTTVRTQSREEARRTQEALLRTARTSRMSRFHR